LRLLGASYSYKNDYSGIAWPALDSGPAPA
jgi:hypothetical protein